MDVGPAPASSGHLEGQWGECCPPGQVPVSLVSAAMDPWNVTSQQSAWQPLCPLPIPCRGCVPRPGLPQEAQGPGKELVLCLQTLERGQMQWPGRCQVWDPPRDGSRAAWCGGRALVVHQTLKCSRNPGKPWCPQLRTVSLDGGSSLWGWGSGPTPTRTGSLASISALGLLATKAQRH